MALDPSKISENSDLIYTAGQIDFCINICKMVRVSFNNSYNINISARSPRPSLVRHAALLMKKALLFDGGIDIDVVNDIELKHCGLGSSSSLISSVAAAINELFGCPLNPLDLVRYCAQNHGEEIENNDDMLVPVQCIGGSGVCGHFEGGLIILAGQATPIMLKRLPKDLKVVIGVPSDFSYPDSRTLMKSEADNIAGFKKSGDEFGPTIAYRLIHKVMPDLANDSLKECKNLIFDYRWDMGSIQNCSFVYPRIIDIANDLRSLRYDNDVDIVALSSVGPGFFVLTRRPKKIKELFQRLNMNIISTTIHNDKYKVLERL